MALKILILTPRIPFPLRDGGAIAMNQTIEGFQAQGCEVSLLAMNTSRHWVEESTLPESYQKLSHFESVYVNNSINPFTAFLNLFTDKSYNISRFINKQYEKALILLLSKYDFDIVWFESIYTSPYLKTVKENSKSLCACRLHNIEHRIWQGLSTNETNFLKKKYLSILTNRLKNYELDILTQFDLLVPISKNEEQDIIKEKLNETYYLPFGVDDRATLPNVKQDKNSCFFIGSMDWAPNAEGVEWFLEKVWKGLHSELGNKTFYIAGKNMPASFLSKASEHIEVVGEVEDFISFSLSKNIMIVPLFSGAGIRIKILEAMALGKTIISTPLAAEGIGAVHHESILLASNEKEFSDYIKLCFEYESLAVRIGKNAKEFVNSHFRNQIIYKEAVSHLQNLLGN